MCARARKIMKKISKIETIFSPYMHPICALYTGEPKNQACQTRQTMQSTIPSVHSFKFDQNWYMWWLIIINNHWLLITINQWLSVISLNFLRSGARAPFFKMAWFCRGARTANWNYRDMFFFLFHPLSFLCSDAPFWSLFVCRVRLNFGELRGASLNHF